MTGSSQVTLVVKSRPGNAGDFRDAGLIPGLGRSPGGGNGNPVQYSCLESSMDGGARRAAVHRVTKSQTQLKRLSTHARGQKGPHQTMNLPAPWLWTSQTLELWESNAGWLSHPVSWCFVTVAWTKTTAFPESQLWASPSIIFSQEIYYVCFSHCTYYNMYLYIFIMYLVKVFFPSIC